MSVSLYAHDAWLSWDAARLHLQCLVALHADYFLVPYHTRIVERELEEIASKHSDTATPERVLPLLALCTRPELEGVRARLLELLARARV